MSTEAACNTAGGFWAGTTGSTCGTINCQNIRVTCCMVDGSCNFIFMVNCTDFFLGTPVSFLSACATTTCPIINQACCLPSGACQVYRPQDCIDPFIGGVPQGQGTTCTASTCQPVTGACCHNTTCSVGSAGSCSGTFQGNNTLCGPTGNPTTCCPANFNQNNGLTVQDIFEFLAAFFSNDPRADFNGSGAVGVQDIFVFLAAWFAGC